MARRRAKLPAGTIVRVVGQAHGLIAGEIFGGPLDGEIVPVAIDTDTFVAYVTDPSHPDNQLRRPATRRCLRSECDATWQSRVALLADRRYCSDACRDKAQREAEQILAELRSDPRVAARG